MSDSRFLQTGRRISMQLKLRTAAGALAHARADWGGGGGWNNITDGYFLMKPIYADPSDAFTYPQNMTRVEKLFS